PRPCRWRSPASSSGRCSVRTTRWRRTASTRRPCTGWGVRRTPARASRPSSRSGPRASPCGRARTCRPSIPGGRPGRSRPRLDQRRTKGEKHAPCALPRGRVTELVGPRSTGRTGLAARIAASATGAGETIAWVDPADALDPEALATAGVRLDRTLWVRPRTPLDALRAAEVLLGAGGFGLVVLDLEAAPRVPRGCALRLTRAAAATSSTLLLLAPAPVAGAGAALALATTGRRVRWSGGPGRLTLLDGIETRLTVALSRVGPSGQALVVRQVCAGGPMP